MVIRVGREVFDDVSLNCKLAVTKHVFWINGDESDEMVHQHVAGFGQGEKTWE
jgi:hypothetical protein